MRCVSVLLLVMGVFTWLRWSLDTVVEMESGHLVEMESGHLVEMESGHIVVDGVWTLVEM